MTYHSGHSISRFAVALFMLCSPALADDSATYTCQSTATCSSSTSSSGYSKDCDVRYRNLELKYTGSECEKAIANCTSNCDQLRSIEGARPKEPMKHISTPLKSLIKDYSPYLYYSLNLEELDATKRAILKRLYRGTASDARKSFSMVATEGTPGDRFAQCIDQIRTSSAPANKEDWAKLVRLKLDNCANQYILYAALEPAYKEKTTKFAYDDPSKPSKRIGLYSHCQPLRMRTGGTVNEYHATHYIIGAWKKLLQTPSHRINNKADKEPRMPSGVTLENPIAPPSPAPDVRVSMLMNTPYEEIIDPSHPFTPRWDYAFNERDEFSPKTEEYSDDAENSVFCAGDKDENIFKVDVLSFRDKAISFSDNMDDRIEYNKKCMNNDEPVAYPCCQYVLITVYPEIVQKCIPQDCETCFNMSAEEPACATNYKATPDRKTHSGYLSVPAMMRQEEEFDTEETWLILANTAIPDATKASCDPMEMRRNKDKVETMCKKLRAPLVPINKLKMRYHNPDEDESEIPSGAMEGMTFKEYFGDHMPYMRLHDTGRSIQESTSEDQDPDDTKGQFTAIVGVGREGIVGGKEDERCLLGGWGGDVNFAGVSIDTPDPITSWTELKLYQARTARKDGVYCIGRYDKVFKPESTEEKVLGAFGGTFSTTRALTGQTEKTRMATVPWPLAWRGYFIDPDNAKRFPNFGGGSPTMRTGLDHAEPGDVVMLSRGGAASGDKPGLPRLGLVLEGTQNDPKKCERNEDCWVKLSIADDGNAPDICGVTDAAGQLVTRYFHKPGFTKGLVDADFSKLGTNNSCVDQNLQHCEFEEWDSAKIYRIRSDVRKGGVSSSSSGGGTP